MIMFKVYGFDDKILPNVYVTYCNSMLHQLDRQYFQLYGSKALV
jgi:hypothetical protein